MRKSHQIGTASTLDHGLFVNGPLFGPISSDRPLFYKDVRIVDDVGYVLINLPTGGGYCPSGKHILLILRRADTRRMQEFGSRTEGGLEISALDQGWSAEELGPKPEQSTRSSVSGGIITKIVSAMPVRPGGPTSGDLRILLTGEIAKRLCKNPGC